MPLEGRDIGSGVGEVGPALLRTEDRIEPFSIEVQKLDFMAAVTQGSQGSVTQRGAVTVRQRMAVDHQGAHAISDPPAGA